MLNIIEYQNIFWKFLLNYKKSSRISSKSTQKKQQTKEKRKKTHPGDVLNIFKVKMSHSETEISEKLNSKVKL